MRCYFFSYSHWRQLAAGSLEQQPTNENPFCSVHREQKPKSTPGTPGFGDGSRDFIMLLEKTRFDRICRFLVTCSRWVVKQHVDIALFKIMPPLFAESVATLCLKKELLAQLFGPETKTTEKSYLRKTKRKDKFISNPNSFAEIDCQANILRRTV